MLEQFSALIVHPACSNLQYGYGVYIFVEISLWRYLCCSTACRTGERTILRTVLDAMVDDGYVIISVANIPFSRLNRTEPDLFLWSHAVTKLATPATGRHTGPQPRDMATCRPGGGRGRYTVTEDLCENERGWRTDSLCTTATPRPCTAPSLTDRISSVPTLENSTAEAPYAVCTACTRALYMPGYPPRHVYALGLLACFAYLLLTHHDHRIMILLNRLAILSW